jgi:hypothetical protein
VAEQLSVGAPLLPFHEPRNPNVVVAPAPRRPFQLTLLAVTTDPLVVEVAFQIWLSCCPFGKVMVTVQKPIVLPPAVTVTSPWKPPGHWLTLRYAAEQVPAPVGGVVVVVEGGVVVVVGVTGGVVGGRVGVAVGVTGGVVVVGPPGKITSLQK